MFNPETANVLPNDVKPGGAKPPVGAGARPGSAGGCHTPRWY